MFSSGQQSSEKASVPQPKYQRESYVEIRRQDPFGLDFVTVAEGYIVPQKPAAVLGVRRADLETGLPL
jgi:hypothetical protein